MSSPSLRQFQQQLSISLRCLDHCAKFPHLLSTARQSVEEIIRLTELVGDHEVNFSDRRLQRRILADLRKESGIIDNVQILANRLGMLQFDS